MKYERSIWQIIVDWFDQQMILTAYLKKKWIKSQKLIGKINFSLRFKIISKHLLLFDHAKANRNVIFQTQTEVANWSIQNH